jgi:hypothetical protein
MPDQGKMTAAGAARADREVVADQLEAAVAEAAGSSNMPDTTGCCWPMGT